MQFLFNGKILETETPTVCFSYVLDFSRAVFHF